jgi:hypothetical protein
MLQVMPPNWMRALSTTLLTEDVVASTTDAFATTVTVSLTTPTCSVTSMRACCQTGVTGLSRCYDCGLTDARERATMATNPLSPISPTMLGNT